MRTPASLLHATTTAAATPAPLPSSSLAPAAMISIDTEMVVIQASLLCALVASCACHRACRPPPSTGNSISTTSPLPSRGLKKKAIDALPVTAAKEGQQEEQCAICLADLAAGEELRVLPRCAHAFHVGCVDAWLRTRATCPSCRATILYYSTSSSPGRCRRCGAACDGDSMAASAAAAAAAVRDESSFLP